MSHADVDARWAGDSLTVRPRIHELLRDRMRIAFEAPPGYGKTTTALEWGLGLASTLVIHLGTRALLPGYQFQPLAAGLLPESLVSILGSAYGHVPLSAPSRGFGSDVPHATTVLVLDDLQTLSPGNRTRVLDAGLGWSRQHPAHVLMAISRSTSTGDISDLSAMFDRVISAADLLFSLHEVEQNAGDWPVRGERQLTPDQVVRLTGGWPVAVTMCDDWYRTGTGASIWYHLSHYFEREVFASLSPEARRQFHSCWALDEVSASLWTELFPDATSNQVFAEVVAHVPLMATLPGLGEPVSWRIPELVRQWLVSSNPATPDHAVAHKAIGYWLGQHHLAQAIVIAGRIDVWKDVIDYLHERCRELAVRDRHAELLGLFENIPLPTIELPADLLFWLALAELSFMRRGEGERYAAKFHDLAAISPDSLQQGRDLVLQALVHIFQGHSDSALNCADRALKVLPADAWHERLRALATLEVLSRHHGNLELADRADRELGDVRKHLPADQRWWSDFIVPNRADWLIKAGRIDDAETLLRHQLSTTDAHANGVLRLRLAIIALERGNPDEADDLLADVMERVDHSYWWMEAALAAVDVRRARGDLDAATELLTSLMADARNRQSPVNSLRPQLVMAEIWIDQGRLDLADSWLALAPRSLDIWPRTYGHPIPRLTRANLAIARQQWDVAKDLLQELIQDGVDRQQHGLLVQIHARLGYVHAAMGDTSAAVDAVRSATVIEQCANFTRSFQVGGTDIRTLLVSARVLPSSGNPSVSSVADLLSEREREVLVLVTQGLTNAEIADRLFISPFTVKNHLARIYRRLGVTNRVQAITLATQLGLVERL